MGEFWRQFGEMFGIAPITDYVNEMEQVDKECQAIFEREGIE